MKYFYTKYQNYANKWKSITFLDYLLYKYDVRLIHFWKAWWGQWKNLSLFAIIWDRSLSNLKSFSSELLSNKTQKIELSGYFRFQLISGLFLSQNWKDDLSDIPPRYLILALDQSFRRQIQTEMKISQMRAAKSSEIFTFNLNFTVFFPCKLNWITHFNAETIAPQKFALFSSFRKFTQLTWLWLFSDGVWSVGTPNLIFF